jgi:two-component system chemotaxis sensor kinase CheA
MIRIFQRIASDRQGFVQFLEEVDGLMASVRRGPDSLEAERRAVHTIKGNASLYGVESMANLCHELETKLREEDRVMNDHERESVSHAWEHVRAISAPLLGDRRAAVELEEDDYRRLLAAIRAGASTEELVGIVVSWRREPVSVRFQRLADKAQYLAKRLGKPPIVVHQQGHGIRLDSLRWNPFWAASVHALNNALDHGIERPEDRRAAGKAEAGQIWLEAEETATGVTISIRDDGAGIDWEKVAAKAAAKGLPNQAHRDLVEALFAEGVSTRDEASLTSGRGTGMGALRDAVRELGGNIEVTSQKGQGTTFTFRFATEARPRIERAA